MMRTWTRQRIVEGLLAFYKSAVAPVVHAAGGACRYQPTCSEYAATAVAEYGWMRGGAMALARLLRCHPLHRGGFDPVPAQRGTDGAGARQMRPSAQRSSAS